jgi:hypothetical protein
MIRSIQRTQRETLFQKRRIIKIKYYEYPGVEKDVFLTKEDKVDIIKWMVGMWVAQIAAIVFLMLKR